MSRYAATKRCGGWWFTRLRAVLAGGLVLGVGATLTLAAWTNSENATGSFTASTFTTESSTVAGVWAHNTTAPGATLAFAATAMSPSTSYYAWVNIRSTTTPPTNVAGVVTLDSETSSGGLAPQLEFRAVRTAQSSTVCDATQFTGTPTFIAGGATTYVPVSSLTGTAVSNSLAVGAELRFCFDIRVAPLTANTFQGQTASVTWKFLATSSS